DYVRWKQNIDRLKLFAMKRPMIVKEFMLEYFGLPFNIYPNPGTESFNIKLLNETDNVIISITDLYGRRVYQTSFTNPDNLISINPELPQGMYLINVCINDMIFTKKIVIL
ncbi:MAG TPA: T9SS type A sorting domain-containing protein, partial [Bacteroidales bacterium]|nr:T9SS type A sorting domain-containing protein [Bacteroidales bacterium]